MGKTDTTVAVVIGALVSLATLFIRDFLENWRRERKSREEARNEARSFVAFTKILLGRNGIYNEGQIQKIFDEQFSKVSHSCRAVYGSQIAAVFSGFVTMMQRRRGGESDGDYSKALDITFNPIYVELI